MTLLGRYGTLGAFVLIVAVFAILSPGAFATPANLVNVTQQMALLAIVAMGATMVMVLGEFDLSVGAVASFAGVAAYTAFGAGWPAILAVPAVLAASFAFGLVSGGLVALFRVPSFITTLALGTVLGGITFWASGGATLFGGAGDGFRALGRGTLAGLPVLTWWLIGTGLATALLLDRLEIGRRLYAIGGNRRAALLAGVPVRRDTVIAFGLCTLLAGLAGLLLAARLGSAHPTGGAGFLLQAYAAVFLGTTAFRDGDANIPGTVLGAAIIAVVANGLTINGVPAHAQDILTGLIIIAAVLVRRALGGGDAI